MEAGGRGCVRCGKGKYEEVEGMLVKEGMYDVEGRLVEKGVLDVEEVNMKKLKGGWWRRVC